MDTANMSFLRAAANKFQNATRVEVPYPWMLAEFKRLGLRKARIIAIIILVISSAAPVHAFWANDAGEILVSLTRSATPEGAAQRRCEVQYGQTEPWFAFLHTFALVGNEGGNSVYAFTCGSLYIIPSHNLVKQFDCVQPGYELDPNNGNCVPIANLCGDGAYQIAFGKCVNGNHGSKQCGPLVGNPIHAGTGNKVVAEKDFTLPSSPYFQMVRYYNSFGDGEQGSVFGGKWRSNYDAKVSYEKISNVERAFIDRPDGRRFAFENQGGDWVSGIGISGRLEPIRDSNSNVAGWTFLSEAGVAESYDASGRLSSLRTNEGNEVALSYGPSGKVVAAMDDGGRTITFSYDANDRLVSVSGPAGAVYKYAYDAYYNLVEVMLPDTTPGNDADNPRRTYHYENFQFPTHLTGITDERGNRVSTWTYDSNGRAISSEHAGGVDDYSLVFNTDGTTTVTTPLGQQRTYGFSEELGVVKVSTVTGGSCDRCGLDGSEYTYDGNGNLASKTDFNGNLTTYTNDELGRELSRTEALGTTDERTISTTWHPELGKPVTISEPGRLTTHTYSTEGSLLSTTVQSQP